MFKQTTRDLDSQPWSRRRLLAVLTVGAVCVVTLVVGLGLNILGAMNPEKEPAAPAELRAQHAPGPDGVRGTAYRNGLAAAPMLATEEDDLRPSPPTMKRTKRFPVGPARASGPMDVPSGFSHTPAGAAAQLAAIEIAALTPLSMDYARDVFDAWALPKAKFSSWEIATSIRDFHANAGTVDGDGSVSLSAHPAGAQIKGTDGDDWVLACVQLDITITATREARAGFGHCERMQWDGTRWRIAPGKPPAAAPSTWPGSERSRLAGWRTWIDPEEDH